MEYFKESTNKKKKDLAYFDERMDHVGGGAYSAHYESTV